MVASMSRPSSLKVTLKLMHEHLTYNPTTGELRTRVRGKLIDPVRATKIAGHSIHPARVAYAMGNNHIWDKVGFLDGNPRNLRLNNLYRSEKSHYTAPGTREARVDLADKQAIADYHRRQSAAMTRKTRSGKYQLSLMVDGKRVTRTDGDRTKLLEWQQKLNSIDSPSDPLPRDIAWATFLRRHFSYDPDTGSLTHVPAGKPIRVFNKHGLIRSIPLPEFVAAPARNLRADRLAWFLATSRLPAMESTMVASPGDFRATSIMWHPDGVPRNDPKPTVKESGDHWLAYVYHNRRTVRVPGRYAIEEEAMDAAQAAALTLRSRWQESQVSLADYMQQNKVEPAPAPAPAVDLTPATPQPTQSITGELRKPWVYTPLPDLDDEDEVTPAPEPDDSDDPEPEFNYTPLPRKPWVYTPPNITLEDLD